MDKYIERANMRNITIEDSKKEKTIDIAKRAIRKGMDNEIVKELTDLDIGKIELIRKELNNQDEFTRYMEENPNIQRMTQLGKSLFREGFEIGIKQELVEFLIKQLTNKFKKVPEEYKEKIKSLPKETIELIATDIFELNSIEELEQYF